MQSIFVVENVGLMVQLRGIKCYLNVLVSSAQRRESEPRTFGESRNRYIFSGWNGKKWFTC